MPRGDVVSRASKWTARLFASWLSIALFIGLLALLFQGSRGIWEPDEGFYVNVATGMMRTGDWATPRLNGEIFLDKPPLEYWSMALGMRALGVNEWGARLVHALLFLGTALLVGALARRLWDERTGRLAVIVYATTLLPFMAANVLTPDTPLTFFTALSAVCYWQAQGSRAERRAVLWWLGLGAGAGLGILTKGPAMLLFLAPFAVHFVAVRGLKGAVTTVPAWGAIVVAFLVGGSWYAWIIATDPGAGAYILNNEIVGRLFTGQYHRNADLWGGLRTYLPALTLGALPWSALWPRLVAKLRARREVGRSGRSRIADPQALMLALSIGVPLAVLFLARSRLLLYVVPLFVPIAIATARGLVQAGWGLVDVRRAWLRPAVLAVWCVLLVSVKGAAAHLPNPHDTRDFAKKIETRLGRRDLEIVAVDSKRNGLSFYGYSDLEWVTIPKDPYPFFTPVETLSEEINEIKTENVPHVFLIPDEKLQKVERMMARADVSCRMMGEVEESNLLMCAVTRTASTVAR